MKIKTLKIELPSETEDEIFKTLIDKFDLSRSDIWGKGQEINFPITEEVECYAKMDLYQDGETDTETGVKTITEQFVVKFNIDFFIDGESIEVKMITTCDKSIDDRIRKAYRIG